MGFSNLPLHAELLKIIEQMGYEDPTAIQQEAIPLILDNQDIRASAPTGTGKTAAYILPLITRIVNNEPTKRHRGPRILVIVPTRELALQVHAEAVKFSRTLKQVRSVCIFGGSSYIVQNKQLAKPYDILIATPGRLIDHIDRQRINLDNLETLILDEADRLLDMGFIEPIEYIADKSPKDRQTLMFSATFGKRVMHLSKRLQNDAQEVIIAPPKMSQFQIEQKLYHVDDIHHKNRLLEHVLQDPSVVQAVVFTATKMDAENISDRLIDQGLDAAALHGGMNQRQRNRTMAQMRDGKIKILVATDVAARGIDIKAISHVINFDLPFCTEDYVHRIGRTGRAGATGIALLFATGREMHFISRLEKDTGLQLTPHTMPGFEPKTSIDSRRGPSSSHRRPGGGGGGRGGRSEGAGKPFRKGGNQRFQRGPKAAQRSNKGRPNLSYA
ncbi:MAG: DEAD/DEAH box helicase [Parachlamydiales bacterium]|nr:DEAD/DEAH box helicase [Parachlamydiales bacterium]